MPCEQVGSITDEKTGNTIEIYRISPDDLCTEEKYNEWYAEASKEDGEIDTCRDRYCSTGAVAKVTQREKIYRFFIIENTDLYEYEEHGTGVYSETHVYEKLEDYGADSKQATRAFNTHCTLDFTSSDPCVGMCSDDCDNDFVRGYVKAYNECVGKLSNPDQWKDVGMGFGTPNIGIWSSSQSTGTYSTDAEGEIQWTEFDKPPNLNNGATGVRACVTLKIYETGEEAKTTKELRVFHWGDKYEPPYKNVARTMHEHTITYEYETFCTANNCNPDMQRVYDEEERKSYNAHYDIQLLEYVFD